ncbi:MAG: Type 4 prepilin-like protein leader peptide-processing enzyme [Candidatus Magasanikbacteria bacterium GW2011_GWA2_56_11]|uniref:Type 4 prepilin-like protein leader peptide-processing enzyme n=1 Tax=Candidatus Magasanikbacteria bacterium GW2011_GWA2_56_11 TaxID=1619044 RepID=A0A0G1YGV8_9BACT|nr:MAG: Type 4 prepilin-like protein leader peptide-processing enzyme [Candidatus Magasanikbacteria bacterium GW2011_GWA2_56_11]
MAVMPVIIFFLGLAFGSFLNALEWRLAHGWSVFQGRSQCTRCARRLAWWENMPVVSFLLLRGRCRSCRQPISLQYPLVELIVAALWVFSWYRAGEPAVASLEFVGAARAAVIVWLSVFLFVYDLKHQEVPDGPVLGGALVIFLLALVTGEPSWGVMLIGAAAGAGFFLWQYLLSRGRWIGGGDVRIGLFIGLAVGWPMVVFALMAAYIIGAVVSVVLVSWRLQSFSGRTPFGTYLSLALLLALWFGPGIVGWYLSLF